MNILKSFRLCSWVSSRYKRLGPRGGNKGAIDHNMKGLLEDSIVILSVLILELAIYSRIPVIHLRFPG